MGSEMCIRDSGNTVQYDSSSKTVDISISGSSGVVVLELLSLMKMKSQHPHSVTLIDTPM